MATTEDGDLIDLANDACVPRVTISDASIVEQEHLLDVCPPKLEQKLSLTRKQEQQYESTDNGDVLVTLGHDQVVPIRKRIDVVSSDTIKRIRDITKNLEPVITRTSSGISDEYQDYQDTVDHGSDAMGKNEEETFEAQEISNAFNFLAEHEDNDEHQEEESRRNVSFDFSVTFESARNFDDDTSSHVPSVERHVPLGNLSFDCSSPKGFRSSNNGGLLSMDNHVGYRQEFDNKINARAGCNFTRDRKRRSLQCPYRKSWTEGASVKAVRNGVRGRIDRSNSLEVHRSDASASDGVQAEYGFLTGCPPEEDSVSASSDVCSEVDWSWLEEVDCLRAAESAGVSIAPVATSCTSTSCDGANTEGGEDQGEGGGAPTNGSVQRRPAGVRRERDASRSVTMSVGATAKSVEFGTPRHSRTNDPNRGGNNNNNNNNAENDGATRNATNEHNQTSSWVRASMRRLRHLRLPDGTDRNRSNAESANRRMTSAPNSLPDIALIAPEILAAQTNGTSGSILRPSSAPARNANGSNDATPRRAVHRCGGSRSRGAGNRDRTSRQSSVVSTVTVSDTTTSGNTTCSSSFGVASSSPPSSTLTSPQCSTSRRICERQRNIGIDDDRGEDEDEDENLLGRWPHALSPTLACLGCTLGLFNISRFAILSIQFGANFIVQFLILSLVLGIPLLTLQVCLGQRLAAGSVDMWRISPIFQGVGVALLIAHALIGIYSIVGVSWMFVYFRDSFITKQDRYRWAEPFLLYREETRPAHNTSTPYKLQETVPDYFSGTVLQRHHLNEPDPGVITLKFQVAFNLAVVWMIVFVSLSKGLRSYGKVVYFFTLVPVLGTLILCTKLLGLTPPGSLHQLFPATVWTEFFINGKSWVAASSEVFLTWGLLGAAAMQIAAHNKHKHLLQRDTSLVIVLTLVVLLLAAFLANTCVQILRHHGYVYTTSSFEKIAGYAFMRPVNQPAPQVYSSTPERFMSHTSFIVGERVIRPGSDFSNESGYQVLRLSTELVPATLALLGTEQVSPFWAVLFYFILILFGIAQQLAIWHCVITGIMAINTKMMKLWETTITFFSCACAYILGLPLATEFGIYVVYYLDYTVGGAWWIMILYLVQIAAVFAVRGRPHTGEAVVAELFPPTGRCLRHWAGPLLSFTWNVILPVTVMVLSVTVFKNGGFRELYSYRHTSRDYWAIWARQLGAAIQLIPILTIPTVGIMQTCRYLNSGPPDIFDRIQLLYRPSLEPEDPRVSQTQISDTSTSVHGNGILPTSTEVPFEDPPPKYTPPPSYTTATGARIAKMLRQSFRRSVRRIATVLGESSTPRQRPTLQPPPPDYATVLVEMNQTVRSNDVAVHVTAESGRDVTQAVRNSRSDVADRHRPNTIDRTMRISQSVGVSTIDRRAIERTHSSLDRGRRSGMNPSSVASNLTAADVANLLRSSIRRGTARTQHTLRRSFCQNEPTTAVSVENLVEAAAPIGQDSLVLPKDVSLVPNKQTNDDNDDKKTADEMVNSVSVI